MPPLPSPQLSRDLISCWILFLESSVRTVTTWGGERAKDRHTEGDTLGLSRAQVIYISLHYISQWRCGIKLSTV
ncbi:hypothetical protein MATL_G00115070 [Megalops atlanticus]|uniref:Uncharacterized protein n=1 Tax=Megalops atlanticus TaxID=7932 RepID=A0A9D3PXJ2_MEGAT|nr:hypothetical protein MATL_G00115070 [Megalops atlanticus]